MLEPDAAVLIPAALEKQITSRIVSRIEARKVSELAKEPNTRYADRALRRAGMYVIPHILCSAGDVTVSCFQQV